MLIKNLFQTNYNSNFSTDILFRIFNEYALNKLYCAIENNIFSDVLHHGNVSAGFKLFEDTLSKLNWSVNLFLIDTFLNLGLCWN